MRNQTRWNIYFSNRLWKPRLWHNLKINFLMRHDARGRFGQKRTGTRKFKRCATFFSGGEGGKRRANDRKTMENVMERGERKRDEEDLDLRFTKLIEWAPPSLFPLLVVRSLITMGEERSLWKRKMVIISGAADIAGWASDLRAALST